MSYIKKRITIISINKPKTVNINDELQWLGNSLGLFHLRDKDKSCFRLFLEFLRAAKNKTPLSSDELAVKTQLTRGTVVHHLNKLMESGLVVQERKRYLLRDPRMELLIEDIEKDFRQAIEDLRKTAKEIDDMLEL